MRFGKHRHNWVPWGPPMNDVVPTALSKKQVSLTPSCGMVHARLKLALGLLLLLLSFSTAPARKSKRWTYPRSQWPVPEHRMDPEPCRLFLWNMASALRFCECSRLLESTASETLWEDTHRQLWLRIPSSSPLLRLFPCQQHSLTRCAKCGHDYRAHVEHAMKRKDRHYDTIILKIVEHARRVGPGKLFQDYRGASVFSDKTNKAKSSAIANGAGAGGGVNDYGANNGDRPSGTGDDNDEGDYFLVWRKRLAVLAEAQRATLLQLSGVHVTSAAVRAAFEADQRKRLQEKAAEEKAERKRGGGGGSRNSRSSGSSGSRIGDVGDDNRKERYGDGRRGDDGGGDGGVLSRIEDRRRRRGRANRGGQGRDSRAKGETEDEVAQRYLREFERTEYIR